MGNPAHAWILVAFFVTTDLKNPVWGNISRSVNGENVLGGVAYKNKYIYIYICIEYGI